MSNESNTRPAITWVTNGTPFKYVITPTDEEWFIRCIWREGKPQSAVGFTLMQRFAALYSRNRPYSTFSDFLRAYCQPVNPKWLPDGELHKARVKRLQNKGDTAGANAEIARAKKRAQYVQTPISKIPAKYRNSAYQVLSGNLLSPVPTATHFTSSFAGANDSPEVAEQKAIAFAKNKNLHLVRIPQGYNRGVNWFFSGPGSLLPPKIALSSVLWTSSFFFALFGLSVLFFAWKRTKA